MKCILCSCLPLQKFVKEGRLLNKGYGYAKIIIHVLAGPTTLVHLSSVKITFYTHNVVRLELPPQNTLKRIIYITPSDGIRILNPMQMSARLG